MLPLNLTGICYAAAYPDERKVDTLKNAEKGTFEVYNLEPIMQCFVFM